MTFVENGYKTKTKRMFGNKSRFYVIDTVAVPQRVWLGCLAVHHL